MKLEKVIAYLIGLLFTCFGVALILKTNWGLDAWNSVFAGLEQITPLSFGMWSIAIQGLFLLIAAILDKKNGMVLYYSYCLQRNIFRHRKDYNFSYLNPSGIGTSILLFVFGYLLVVLGTGLYVATGYPKMPIDGLMTALSDSFLGNIKKSRLLIEIVGFTFLILVRGPSASAQSSPLLLLAISFLQQKI